MTEGAIKETKRQKKEKKEREGKKRKATGGGERNGSRAVRLRREAARGRDRRQKHRRHVGQKSLGARAPGKIRSPIVYIEIRSCRNAPRAR